MSYLSPDLDGAVVPKSGCWRLPTTRLFVVVVLDLFFMGSVVCWFGLPMPGDLDAVSDRGSDQDSPCQSQERIS